MSSELTSARKPREPELIPSTFESESCSARRMVPSPPIANITSAFMWANGIPFRPKARARSDSSSTSCFDSSLARTCVAHSIALGIRGFAVIPNFMKVPPRSDGLRRPRGPYAQST